MTDNPLVPRGMEIQAFDLMLEGMKRNMPHVDVVAFMARANPNATKQDMVADIVGRISDEWTAVFLVRAALAMLERARDGGLTMTDGAKANIRLAIACLNCAMDDSSEEISWWKRSLWERMNAGDLLKVRGDE